MTWDRGSGEGEGEGQADEASERRAPLRWVPADPESSPPPPGPEEWAKADLELRPPGGRDSRRHPLRRAVSIVGIFALVALVGYAAELYQSQARRSGNRSPGLGGSPSSGQAPPTSRRASRMLGAVAASDLPEIVMVVAVGTTSEELGTAWPLDDRGDFLTNDHVVHSGQSFHVVLASGEQYAAEVTNDDPALDLAEIHVWNYREQPLPLSTMLPPLGEPVVVLAAQGATGHAPVTDSSVNGLDQRATVSDAAPGELSSYSGLLRIRAKIFPGNSGGPVISPRGQVVGILTLAAASGTGAFAIPIANVDAVIRSWLAG